MSEHNTQETGTAKAVLVTGAAGYIGRLVVADLAGNRDGIDAVVAMDLREVPEADRLPGVTYVAMDIRDAAMADVMVEHHINTVVHLAAVVNPNGAMTPQMEYEIDVLGTKNVLDACVKTGVAQFIVTSSGAAYGYHADNPQWLSETDALRGNDEFPYSKHKRLVEEMLAEYRREHPSVKQLIFRPGTVLGASVKNQITNLFEKKFVLGIRGSGTPFVFIWDQDVVGCIVEGIRTGKSGIYNLAGDGVMTMADIAKRLGKPFVAIPPGVLGTALGIMKKIGVGRYGPEQVRFLQYRPVLSNEQLKAGFGYVPRKTSAEVFDLYCEHQHAT